MIWSWRDKKILRGATFAPPTENDSNSNARLRNATVLTYLLELLNSTLVDTSALVDEMACGG